MEYQITRATEQTGQIEILYKQDGKPVATYAIDLPVIDGKYITGAELELEIQHRAPVWVAARTEEVKTASNFADIAALVVPLVNQPQDTEAMANAAMWEQVAYEQRLCKALVKFNVIKSDPTTIAVVEL
jgi:hypothetical protein